MYIFGAFVKNELVVDVWIYFSGLYSNGFMCLFLMPGPCCSGGYGSVVYLQIRYCDASRFVLSIQDCFRYSGAFAFCNSM
jgi:hypothetical protein